MCQFKTALASAPGGGGCGTCRCQAVGATGGTTVTAAATAAAAAVVLMQMPSELVMRYLTDARSPSPSSCDQVDSAAVEVPVEAVEEAAVEAAPCSRYSPAMAADLEEGRQADSNNNESCLKTARSLPSEGRRVQFADELGGSLTEVRLFESEPQLPIEVQPPLDLLLQCQFDQPTAERALRALMTDECNVQLSGLRLDRASGGVSLSGYALVKNVSFRKRVFVRITADSWQSSADLEADYAGSLDDSRDAFEFELRCEIEEVDFEFCVCFEAEGHGTHWDCNGGSNYRASLVKPQRATFSIWGDEDDEDEF